jgi:hypothetical protein
MFLFHNRSPQSDTLRADPNRLIQDIGHASVPDPMDDHGCRQNQKRSLKLPDPAAFIAVSGIPSVFVSAICHLCSFPSVQPYPGVQCLITVSHTDTIM